jgi:hypothetical protein
MSAKGVFHAVLAAVLLAVVILGMLAGSPCYPAEPAKAAGEVRITLIPTGQWAWILPVAGADGNPCLRIRTMGPDGEPLVLTVEVYKGGPVPPPPPVPTELWAIIIEESAERTPQQAIVIASPKVRALFRGWRLHDPKKDATTDNPTPVELQSYVDRVANPDAHLKKPALFVVDAQGVVYHEGALPATVAAMEVLVAKIKGGGK